jgi:hypothetical protein
MYLTPEDGALFLAGLTRSRKDLEKKCTAVHCTNADTTDTEGKCHPSNVDALRAMARR